MRYLHVIQKKNFFTRILRKINTISKKKVVYSADKQYDYKNQ